MNTSTALDPRVRSNLARHSGEGAHAKRSTGSRHGGIPLSTFEEDRIVQNELWLTLIDQRRTNLLATKTRHHRQARHLDLLDSWEASIQHRLANAWFVRHSGLLRAERESARRAMPSASHRNGARAAADFAAACAW